MIRASDVSDAEQICAIYNHYVERTVITFEETPVVERDMAQRIADVTQRLPWLVWEQDGSVGKLGRWVHVGYWELML